MNDHPDHALCAQLQSVSAALRDLTVTGSPVATQVAEVLCEYGETPDGSAEAVLVVPRRQWVEAVRAWLVNEEFDCVDVACPADLRSPLVVHRAAVLVGHPATAFSSAFRAPEVALRENGWLLTAPAAPQVRLVLTADEPPLRARDAWLLPAAAHAPLPMRDEGPQRSEPIPREWLHPLDSSAPVRHTPPPASGGGEDVTLAVEVHLASGHAALFHAELGPRPHVVAVDEETGAVALSAAPLSRVNRGVVLAVRVGTAPQSR